jgi:predicted Zn finger-like uncharacterized protein
MKFTCDSCGAAYMISDDKVGPGGVKVRCKKCGNVVTVKRVEEPPVVAPAAAPAAPPAGLDDELGSAFDHAFGGTPAPAPAAEPAAPVAEPATAQPAPPATEWYVAIGEAQVGPLPLAEVKKKWEAGDVGPDSLVWRPGMADWGPLSGVPDLAAYLSPIPQPARPQAAPAAAVTSVEVPVAPRAAAPAPAAPAADVEWKPAGASALAAMASEELASREPAAAPAAPRSAPVRSLMEQLPDSGGVDPTGAVPLPIKGMERTDERPVRRSSVARGAEELRHKRTVRNVVIGGVVLVAVAAGAGYAVYTFTGRQAAPAPVVAAPAPVPPPAPPPAATATAPAATPASTPIPTPTPAPTATATATATPTPAATPPPAPPPAPAKAPPAKEPPKAVAKAPAPTKAPAPAKAPPAAKPAAAAAADKPAGAPKKKDSVLDFDQGAEDDLTAALGGAGSRTVYVPPKPGGAGVPDRLSDAQITESVKLHVDALRRCAAEQQAREPGAKGTLKMAWTIQPDGNPKDVRCLTPDLAAGPFAQCITGVVKGIRFPRIGDAKGQPVTFPFGY